MEDSVYCDAINNGSSLTDPNNKALVRNKLSVQRRFHYAILTKDGMSNKALMRASNHFARLGIEIIWADDFNEIPRLLRRLLIKRFDSFKSEKAKYYNPQ